jgi:hypothetical protein
VPVLPLQFRCLGGGAVALMTGDVAEGNCLAEPTGRRRDLWSSVSPLVGDGCSAGGAVWHMWIVDECAGSRGPDWRRGFVFPIRFVVATLRQYARMWHDLAREIERGTGCAGHLVRRKVDNEVWGLAKAAVHADRSFQLAAAFMFMSRRRSLQVSRYPLIEYCFGTAIEAAVDGSPGGVR